MSTYIQDPSTLSLQNFETYYISNHMIISKSGKVAQVGVISKTYLTDNFKIINTYLFQTLKCFYLDFSKEMSSSFKVECVCVCVGGWIVTRNTPSIPESMSLRQIWLPKYLMTVDTK